MSLLLHPALVNIVILPPSALLLWAWIRLPRLTSAHVPAYLRYLPVCSMALLTFSVLVDILLPVVTVSSSDSADRVGIPSAWAVSIVGTLCAAFTRWPLRLVALVAGVMLICIWFFVGALV